ncbi:hypothetical protein, partial [Fischerella thermalis]|uniref:hypothetical protein n=1 Tax=Fischerella thermalis TaxID=372787 RepID=UPI000CB2D6B6
SLRIYSQAGYGVGARCQVTNICSQRQTANILQLLLIHIGIKNYCQLFLSDFQVANIAIFHCIQYTFISLRTHGEGLFL